jgi:hypothetical protein
MFQSVMDQEKRRNIGAHYTSEKNIMKIVKSLFLDELYSEFGKVKNNRKQLMQFHEKLSKLKFLDPACGCGNFLIISYRELRLLELKLLKVLYPDKDTMLDFGTKFFSMIDVDQFYGIEIEEFPAKVAELALWLTDHQMNILFSKEFGHYFARLPLTKSPTIKIGNALRIEWNSLVKKQDLNYILGNPPFIGKQYQENEQKDDLNLVFNSVKGSGVLDYVSCWHYLAAQYITGTKIKVSFVSTNSISQGEQVGILWNELFNKLGIKIHFAHRTFKWNNEAKNQANVYVVIIGFANFDTPDKYIFDYDSPTSDPHERKVKNICPYLTEGSDIVILKRRNSISVAPNISFGSMPNDGGYLLLTDEERNEILSREPEIQKYIKPLISAREYLNNLKRWCFWLVDIQPNEIRNSREIQNRIQKVRETRQKSKRLATKILAETPTLFGEIRHPNTNYIMIPLTTSENRKYIPMDLLTQDNIANNSIGIVHDANLYDFGILTSFMHMTWVNYVCGRLEGRYRYSNEIVYNNFPWPKNPLLSNRRQVEKFAQNILDVRKHFVDSTLADLYDPLSMPPDLVKAHNSLDKAVDKCYRSQPFTSELNRLEFLFNMYEEYTAGLLTVVKKKNKRR